MDPTGSRESFVMRLSRFAFRGTMKHRGFTLVELVIVLVLLGLLAAYAAPRILDTQAFNTRGLYDQTQALLRYAQKVAIAQRRTVCIRFTSTVATLTMASTSGATSCTPATPLTGPQGEIPAAITAKGAATYGTTPLQLNFNGLGQPINDLGAAWATVQTVNITNGPAGGITVQPVTGYVQ